MKLDGLTDGKTDGALNISTLRITNEILRRIAELDEFKGAWQAIGRIAPKRLSSLCRVATIESVGSSTRIEGAKLSNREVESLLLAIAIFIVTFLEIHPFQDGNGRLSRILTTLLLLREGYSYVPYSSLESIVEAVNEDYYRALGQTHGTIRSDDPDWQPWIQYFLKTLTQQKRNLEKKIEREKLILGDLPDLSVTIRELAHEHGRVTVADIAATTGTSRNTVKDHLKALTKAEHLRRNGAGRGTWYELK